MASLTQGNVFLPSKPTVTRHVRELYGLAYPQDGVPTGVGPEHEHGGQQERKPQSIYN